MTVSPPRRAVIPRLLCSTGAPGEVRVVVLGMSCDFTRVMLDALLHEETGATGINLAAVILAVPGAEPSVDMGRPAGFPMVPERTPVWRLGSRSILPDESWLARLGELAPDVIVAGCFPWRLPEAVLAIPRFGCLNVHPSLLPDGRGPEPVFWAFRWGLRETGVTVHRMDHDFDTGPVHAQARVPIADDATMPSLETALASRGGRLARQVILALAHDSATVIPQPGSPSRWARFPGPADLTVSTDWPAIDAARFIRAVSPVFGPVTCFMMATGQRVGQRVGQRGAARFGSHDVLDVREHDAQAEPVVRAGDTISIRFSPGIIRFRLMPDAIPLTLHPRRPGSG